MDPQIIELLHIEPAQLDNFLSIGWFRTGQTIFTTDSLYYNGRNYDAIWLRVRLDDFFPDKKYRTLEKKNSRFGIEIKKENITPAHEVLYHSYLQSIPFEAATSIHSLLYGESSLNVYDTWMINVYDNDTLIGTGCFDLGSNSVAGIFSVYDPAYKKYSLGKFMIYEKMLFCKRKNFTYFYPGYFVPGYARFDYKLELGKQSMEYFDPAQIKWFSLNGKPGQLL